MNLEPPGHLPPDVAAVWVETVAARGGEVVLGPELEAYAGQVARLRDAQRRLADEGTVIATAKGDPVPHPALAIEKAAQVEIRNWGPKFRPRVL